MLSSESLLKYLAIIFLFMVMVGCAVTAFLEILNGQQPNPYIISILGSGLGYSINAAGVTHGSAIVKSVTVAADGLHS